ncbi:MAG: FRG domain-containing protein [Leptothrix sp. (in: b-proteobacteria)]
MPTAITNGEIVIYQQFGELTGLATLSEAMLCIDQDRPHEFLITIFPTNHPPFAVLAFAEDLRTETIKLKPRNLLKPQANGGLHYPPLEQIEIQALTSSEILLNPANDGGYTGTWKTHDKTGTLAFNATQPQSDLETDVLSSWQEFKNWAAQVHTTLDVSLFRGHGSNKFELSTTFHRTGRNRLERYCSDTLARFHGEAEAELGLRLDMNDGADYSIVLGLAQHHGLPTPLLDWTQSPYIAAFFAFSDALDAAHRKEESHVRIFALSRQFVDQTSPASVVLTWPRPFVASLAISSRHNARLRAQQGRFLVTNIANLGAWLRTTERRLGERFLYAVDIPVSCATEALQDLAFMGLTAATMFPGLDGVCRALRHEMAFTKPVVKVPGLPAPDQANGAQPRNDCDIQHPDE